MICKGWDGMGREGKGREGMGRDGMGWDGIWIRDEEDEGMMRD